MNKLFRLLLVIIVMWNIMPASLQESQIECGKLGSFMAWEIFQQLEKEEK